MEELCIKINNFDDDLNLKIKELDGIAKRKGKKINIQIEDDKEPLHELLIGSFKDSKGSVDIYFLKFLTVEQINKIVNFANSI